MSFMMWQLHQVPEYRISQVGARFVDRETNMSEVEIRPPREEARIDIEHIHSKSVQVPTSCSELSSHDTDIVERLLSKTVYTWCNATIRQSYFYSCKKKTCTRI